MTSSAHLLVDGEFVESGPCSRSSPRASTPWSVSLAEAAPLAVQRWS